MTQNPADERGLSPGFQLLAFLTACAIIIARRPDGIFHAQFFAEDGHVWFADAYNRGWLRPLFWSQDGYFQTLPRLAASLALLVPLAAAPLVMNLAALLFQALPVNLLLSDRLSGWGSLRFRAALAFVFLVLPNSREMSLTIEEGQWYLAVTACLLVLASVPKSAAWRVFDTSIYLLCGLTGIFCVLLLPGAAAFLWIRRERWRWVPAGILAATAAVQLSALLVTDAAARGNGAVLGPTPQLFVRILTGHVYLGALIGASMLSVNAGLPWLLLAAVCGTAVVAMAWAWATVEFRLFLVFAALVFAGSLYSPTTGPPNGNSQWLTLALTPAIRYWFIPTLAFAWCVVSLAEMRGRNAAMRIMAPGLLLVMCYGVLSDFRNAPMPDLDFGRFAAEVEAAAPGTLVTIPVNPAGWSLTLIKR